MERLSETILRHAQGQPEGTPLLAKRLLHLGSRAAIDQALSRLVRRGALLRAGRGVYLLPVESRFGRRAPSADKTVEGLAAARGERVANSGAMAANLLGLTTQLPARHVYLTSGPNRMLTLGRQEIEMRHAPEWQLVLAGRRAGDAVRALAWLGRGRADAAVVVVRQQLKEEERREVASVSAQMPGWLAGPVRAVADGRTLRESTRSGFFRSDGRARREARQARSNSNAIPGSPATTSPSRYTSRPFKNVCVIRAPNVTPENGVHPHL